MLVPAPACFQLMRSSFPAIAPLAFVQSSRAPPIQICTSESYLARLSGRESAPPPHVAGGDSRPLGDHKLTFEPRMSECAQNQGTMPSRRPPPKHRRQTSVVHNPLVFSCTIPLRLVSYSSPCLCSAVSPHYRGLPSSLRFALLLAALRTSTCAAAQR